MHTMYMYVLSNAYTLYMYLYNYCQWSLSSCLHIYTRKCLIHPDRILSMLSIHVHVHVYTSTGIVITLIIC